MTKKIELWLNIIHYCIYKLDYRLHLFSNKLNPFLLLGKIPAIKRKFDEQGTTQEEVVNRVWGDKRFGFGIMISGASIAMIVFIIIWTIFLIINSLFSDPLSFSPFPFIVCMIAAYLICHVTIFKKDKYLNYFNKFNNWTIKEKWRYGLISFIAIMVSFSLFILSFNFLPD